MFLDAYGCFWMLLDVSGCFWMFLASTFTLTIIKKIPSDTITKLLDFTGLIHVPCVQLILPAQKLSPPRPKCSTRHQVLTAQAAHQNTFFSLSAYCIHRTLGSCNHAKEFKRLMVDAHLSHRNRAVHRLNRQKCNQPEEQIPQVGSTRCSCCGPSPFRKRTAALLLPGLCSTQWVDFGSSGLK